MKKVYAFKNTQEELLKSSSGGAFIAICKAFNQKYKNEKKAFYGATYDEKLNIVHKRVENVKECCIFQGAKYVKSNHSLILKEIEKDLKNNVKILISGTPCQISSIKKYLEVKKINYDDCLFIDIICHGTPQVKFWNDYKKWLENKENSKLINYSFRYKKEGWKAYPAYAEFSNGKKLINTAETSIYSKLHMLGFITNNHCFSCPFAKQEREGDITLGDYWGIENILTSFPYKNGVSLLIVNNDKNYDIIELLNKNNDYLIKETNSEMYLKYQHNLNNPTKKPERYDEFWNDYENNDFEYILKKYLNYGFKYKIMFNIKKIIRKTPFIDIYRKIKNR